MDKQSYQVIWKERAKKSLQNIFLYIYKDSPENAIKFNDKLIEFGESIGYIPEKYPISRHKSYKKRNFRSATFKKNYVFLYKIIDNKIVIFNIVHAKRIS